MTLRPPPNSPGVWLGLSLFALSMGFAAQVTITRGPYLQNVTSNSIVVHWRTDVPCDSRVQFRTGSNPFAAVLDSTVVTNHEVMISGLEANTHYAYAVGTSAADLAAGANYEFTTAPLTAKPVRIWVLGDTRSTITDDTGDSRQRVREAFLNFAGERQPDLVFNTGDLADNGYDHELQEAFFDVYAADLRRWPFYACLGNHDLGVARGQPYLDAFTFPSAGQAGGVASGTERYYSFNYSSIHFVVLDCYGAESTATGEIDPVYRDQQVAWLRRDLETNRQPWVVAMFHSPPYTWGSHNSDWEWDQVSARAYFVPVLEEFGVDLVLSGHSHNYERSFLLRGHYGDSSTLTAAMKRNDGNGHPGVQGAYYKPASQSGTVYVVIGSSGFLGWGVSGHPAMAYSANDLGSVILDIEGDVLQARFLRDTRAVDDYFVIVKGNQPPAVRVSAIRVQDGQVHLQWPTVEGFRYRVYRHLTLGGAREPVSPELPAAGYSLEWFEPIGGSTAAFYEVQTIAERNE